MVAVVRSVGLGCEGGDMDLPGICGIWTAEVTGATGTDGYWVREFHRAACGELNAFVAQVETLTPDRWRRPTPCVGWRIRDLVEHTSPMLPATAGTPASCGVRA